MKLGIKERLDSIKALNKQIKWEWKFGVSKSEPQNYSLIMESEPIDSKIFVETVKIISKEHYRFPLDDLVEDEETELPRENWEAHQDKILTIFPNVKLGKETFLSKRLHTLYITKTKKGLVLRGEIRGLRVC